jgi:hypothetical protein
MSLITVAILVLVLLAPAHAGSRALKDAQDDIKAFRKDTGKSTSRPETTGPQPQPEAKSEPPAITARPVASALSAKITRVERQPGGFIYFLVVIDNQSDRIFSSMMWSCTFYNNDEPVHEDSFAVLQVGRGETTSRQVTAFGGSVTATRCRPTMAF